MDGAVAVLSSGPDSLLTPQNVVLALLLATVLGGYIGWWIRSVRAESRKKAVDAFESELVRAAGRARERARQEKALMEERLGRIQDEHDGCARKIRGLELKVRDSTASIEKLKASLTRARPTRSNGGNGHRKRAAGPSASTRVQAKKGNGSPEWLVRTNGDKDDLQTIRGLGPVIERRLNALGIFQYRQLACLEPEHIAWIASQIHILVGRIQHDEWIDQARAEHFEKYKERL